MILPALTRGVFSISFPSALSP
ncbi:hypothetical protein EMIT0P2_30291 [Pseudomonas sp. IT-P2]